MQNIKHITSRFGEMIDDNQVETPVIKTLIDCMDGELNFVGTYDNRLGLIMELEFDDGVQLNDNIRSAWSRVMVPEGVILATPEADSPDYQMFNDRAGLWAFVPAELVTPILMNRLTDEAMKIADAYYVGEGA